MTQTNFVIDIVGYSAAVVGTSMMLPQVVKSFRTKQVDDLAMMSVLLYILNCALWLMYGILIRATPVTLANALALVISLCQLGLKWTYGTRQVKARQEE